MSILPSNLEKPNRSQEAWKYMDLSEVWETTYAAVSESYRVESQAASIQGNLPVDPVILKRFANPFLEAASLKHQRSLVLNISENTCARDPIHVQFASEAGGPGPSAVFPRVHVRVAEGIHARIILDLAAPEHTAALSDGACTVTLDADSHLQLFVRGRNGADVLTFLNIAVDQQKDSIFEAAVYQSGSRAERVDIKANLSGENAQFDVRGLQLLAGADQAFNHLEVSHRAPHTRSNQVFRSVLMGKAVAEFNSMVHVTRSGSQAESDQLNKNLLLSEEARAYSRPQLKIDTDEVRCNHGSAAGQLNPEEIYYLRSRGFSENAARSLIVHGFAEEFLSALPKGQVREAVRNDIEARLGAMQC